MLWQCLPLVGSVSSQECNQFGYGVVLFVYARSIFWTLCDDQKCPPTQDRKGGKLQESESSLICVVITQGFANALPVIISILTHFYIPVSLHNKNVLLRSPINDILQLVIKFFHFIVWCWGVCLYYCDVTRECPKADGDKPAGDWATSHDSVHDVLVKNKSNAVLVSSLFDLRKPCVFFSVVVSPRSAISFHRVQGWSICTCPFSVLAPGVSSQLLVSLCSMCQWWCCLFRESRMVHEMLLVDYPRLTLRPGVPRKVRSSLTRAATDPIWSGFWLLFYGDSIMTFQIEISTPSPRNDLFKYNFSLYIFWQCSLQLIPLRVAVLLCI